MGSPIHLRPDYSLDRAIYLQLADAILLLIRNGQLAPGQKLPSTRDLATIACVNRITITKAIEELQLQGWLESHVGRGTFVTAHIPKLEPGRLHTAALEKARVKAGFTIGSKPKLEYIPPMTSTGLHLDDGFTDARLAPIKELYRAYRNQLTKSGVYHKFGSYHYDYNATLSQYLNETRGLKTTAKNILSVRGRLNLVSNALLKPGDVVVSGVPGWKKAVLNFNHVQAKHVGIPVDEHGIVVDALRKLCKKQKVRMVYVVPHQHYPTTVPLRLDRRLELLSLANEYGFIIFEDDYEFDFHYKRRPLMPLASADENGMVIYCGSFSKYFSPAFRMGYLVASENVIEHLEYYRSLLDRQGDHFMDSAIAALLNDGTITRYLRKALPVYEARRDLLCSLLSSELGDVVNFTVPEGGGAVWTEFDKSVDLKKLSRQAANNGLIISDGSIHQYPNFDTNAIRLGFASSTEKEIIKSVEILKRSL
jgi:GntR family transcriptional regulator/MocR family aminotransferase